MIQTIGELAAERAAERRKQIRKIMADNLGITPREIGVIVGLEPRAVHSHIKKIREEWKK